MTNVSAPQSHDEIPSSHGTQAKIAHTIPEAVRASGLSRSTIYLAISSGALCARKSGSRTLILDADLRQFLRSLPLTKSNTGPGAAA
jgi:helix-turn-helix protein